MSKCESVNINGTDYVRADLAATPKKDGMEYCIIRTYSAGVFAAYLEKLEGTYAIIREARRVWKWSGAMTLSDLAMFGPKNKTECRFCVPVDREMLTQVIEILPMTSAAKAVFDEVPEWKS